MGECYFMKIFYSHRGEKLKNPIREDIMISSEDLGAMLQKIDPFPRSGPNWQRFLNATAGIWFYESDLWDKEELKKQLRQLINEIDKFEGDPFKDLSKLVKRDNSRL